MVAGMVRLPWQHAVASGLETDDVGFGIDVFAGVASSDWSWQAAPWRATSVLVLLGAGLVVATATVWARRSRRRRDAVLGFAVLIVAADLAAGIVSRSAETAIADAGVARVWAGPSVAGLGLAFVLGASAVSFVRAAVRTTPSRSDENGG